MEIWTWTHLVKSSEICSEFGEFVVSYRLQVLCYSKIKSKSYVDNKFNR